MKFFEDEYRKNGES